eukprot:572137-Pyramimonas_sp.AAC.1
MLYREDWGIITFGGKKSGSYPIRRGVRQGALEARASSVSATTLFCVGRGLDFGARATVFGACG